MKKIITQKSSVPGVKDASGAYVKVGPPPPFKLSDFLFPKQLKFVEDPRPYKVAVCSRRAGKTVACAAHLVSAALNNPGVNCLYITLSRNNAKKLVWPEIKKINNNHCLGGEEDLTELSMTFPNGSIIYLSGAKDESEIEKFRGLALYLAYIDEAQSFRPYIQELIDDILTPALMDHDGTLCIIGTPGAIATGLLAEITGQVKEKQALADAWSQHHWTYWDNPRLPFLAKGKTHQQQLDRELKRRGVTVEDPSIQREWFGKWVTDSNSLWIKYNPKINDYTEFSLNKKWNYILGIDLGFNDADALAVLAWNEQDPTTYLVEELVVPKQGITELVQEIQDFQKKYDISKMVIDTGGLGKKIAEELIRRHHIPVEAADKTRKYEAAELLNDALRSGRFKAKPSSRFAQDTYLVEKDASKSRPDRIALSDRYHSDIIDAVLYAFRCSPAFTYQAPEVKALPGTPQWFIDQQNDMFEQAVEHFTKEEEAKGDWRNDY